MAKTIVNHNSCATVTTHQKAVNSLLECALASQLPPGFGKRDIPYHKVPELLRRAIKASRDNAYKEEVTILEHALRLFEEGGIEPKLTSEQQKFLDDLGWWLDINNNFRVKYDPQNVTVN